METFKETSDITMACHKRHTKRLLDLAKKRGATKDEMENILIVGINDLADSLDLKHSVIRSIERD